MKKLLLIIGMAVGAPLLAAQTLAFNCPSGWVSTLAASCGVGFGGVNGPGTFQVTGTPNGYPAVLSGSQVELAIPTANHIGLNLNYWSQAVGVQAFVANYTFVPNGWNLSFVLNNTTNHLGGFNGQNFASGAGCEGSIFQAFNDPWPYDPPNNLFAVMLDQKSPLGDANGVDSGGGSASFTYSGVQVYQQGQDPCNPRDGTEQYFYFTQRVSTSPVPLNSPASTPNTTTGDTYSMTVIYTGSSNVTVELYDVTAGGSCPGASCFSYTFSNTSVPSMVGATTAWVGLAASTNAASGYPLYLDSFSYATLAAAATPTFSVSAGSYSSTQSVTISDGSTGSIICYNLAGNPSTNGIGGCENGTLYTGAISVSKGETIYAIAGAGTSDYGDSAVASAAYSISGYASTPTFSVSSGAYQGDQTVILTAAQGRVICYDATGSPATNGSTGCTSGTLYTGPIAVSSNETLYAVAGGAGYTDSPVSSAAYVLNQYWGTYADSPLPPNTPTFSLVPGTYFGSQLVTLATSTAPGYICYEVSATPLTVGPFPDSMGGCASGTLYTGPITVSSSEYLYAIAGVPNTAYTFSGCSGNCTGGSAPSTPTVAAYTIVPSAGTPPQVLLAARK